VPNLAKLAAPLYLLLKGKAVWNWGEKQQTAFDEIKAELASNRVLTHFDPKKPIVLSTDASAYDIGAVLSHRFPGGELRPIHFISRTLNDAEKNYSQLDKEGLAIYWAVRRLRLYLLGLPFEIETDQKPLESVFHPYKPLPEKCTPRVQWWALTLANYRYTIKYIPGKDLGHADSLSRAPVEVAPENSEPRLESIFFFQDWSCAPITLREIKAEQGCLETFQIASADLRAGKESEKLFEKFRKGFSEFCVIDETLFYRNCIVIPLKLVLPVLHMFHDGHVGAEKMVELLRQYCWWPGQSGHVEKFAKSCNQCQVNTSLLKQETFTWAYPESVFDWVHIDFFELPSGQKVFVFVDAHSRWTEARVTSGLKTSDAIGALTSIFAAHGIQKSVVSDGGLAFKSSKMSEFFAKFAIEHVFAPPYHPTSNGLA
jgi:hypothetical protein